MKKSSPPNFFRKSLRPLIFSKKSSPLSMVPAGFPINFDPFRYSLQKVLRSPDISRLYSPHNYSFRKRKNSSPLSIVPARLPDHLYPLNCESLGFFFRPILSPSPVSNWVKAIRDFPSFRAGTKRGGDFS